MAFDNYNCLPSDQIICIFSWELYIFETEKMVVLSGGNLYNSSLFNKLEVTSVV